jgi:hypothetical protein
MVASPFNANGRLKVPVGVTPAKLKAIKGLVEETLSGGLIARGYFEEAMQSSDAIFAYAHLTNLNVLPEFDKLEPTWKQIAGTREVPNFRKPILYSLVSQFSGVEEEGADPSGIAPNGIAPVVPEGAAYPYAYMSGDEAVSGGIKKRGFKTDFTFETFINDSIGFIQALPGNIVHVAADTADYEVYSALINGVGSAQKLLGGPTPDGVTTVTVNAPFSRAALLRAKYEMTQRKIQNRYIQITGGFNLVVPYGQADFVKFQLALGLAEITDGSTSLSVSGFNPFADVTVIQTEWVTGTNWYLIPKPGATRRPVLDYGLLIGHTAPELRVENATGTYFGGSSVTPFEGDFNTDSATFRLRQIGGGILWTPQLVIWSNGTGA